MRLDGKSVVDDTMESDKSLLMEIMELNERIDELKSKDDAEDLSRELAGVVSQLVRLVILIYIIQIVSTTESIE